MMFSSTLQGKKLNVPLIAKVVVTIGFLYFLLHFLWPLASTSAILAHGSLSAEGRVPKNVAAIIEDRPLSNLAPLILHFSSVLGPAWPIVLFTSGDNAQLDLSVPFRRAIDEGRISIRSLPSDIRFENHASVSEFLTGPWFWEQLAPAGHILMFQADSIVCANSEKRLEDFLDYDFVGAPIDVSGGHGEGYNGGISLRNRTMILDIVNKFSWTGEKEDGTISEEGCVTKAPCLKFEDQWFYHKMKDMPGARLPSKEVAASFAVETVWYDTPLAYHQVERWNGNKMDQVGQWCPEYKMTTTDLIVKQNQGEKGTR